MNTPQTDVKQPSSSAPAPCPGCDAAKPTHQLCCFVCFARVLSMRVRFGLASKNSYYRACAEGDALIYLGLEKQRRAVAQANTLFPAEVPE